MKVYIGPYKEWWGPYQIANLIPFASEETRDKIGDWLAKTWVSDLCERIHKIRGERDIKVRIDKYDTWSMDHTLAHIILPMLKQLQETKHGSQWVDDEDLPLYMRHGNPDGHDNWVHYKWEWVLNEIIFAFESKLDDSWEDQFRHGEAEYKWDLVSGNEEDDENAVYQVNQINPDFWFDMDGYKLYNDRIQNGFRLFGKYYQGLWD